MSRKEQKEQKARVEFERAARGLPASTGMEARTAFKRAFECIQKTNGDVEEFRQALKGVSQEGLNLLLIQAFRRVELAIENTHAYYDEIMDEKQYVERDRAKEGDLVVKREEAFHKFKKFADVLVDAGAQIGWKKNGRNFLHRCAYFGAADVIHWAVKEKGFSDLEERVGEEDKDCPGLTALHIACGLQNMDAAVALVELGGDFHALSPEGHKPWEMLPDEDSRDEFCEAHKTRSIFVIHGLDAPKPAHIEFPTI